MATTAAEGAATTGGADGGLDAAAAAAASTPPLPAPSPPAPISIRDAPPRPPPRTTTTTTKTKRCDGPCGLTKDEGGYSITMW